MLPLLVDFLRPNGNSGRTLAPIECAELPRSAQVRLRLQIAIQDRDHASGFPMASTSGSS